MNTMGLVQNKWHHINFAWDPLRSYFDECQKNEIYLLYLHFTLYFYIIFVQYL